MRAKYIPLPTTTITWLEYHEKRSFEIIFFSLSIFLHVGCKQHVLVLVCARENLIPSFYHHCYYYTKLLHQPGTELLCGRKVQLLCGFCSDFYCHVNKMIPTNKTANKKLVEVTWWKGSFQEHLKFCTNLELLNPRHTFVGDN